MELADVTDSKSVGSDTVWVRVPPPAPKIRMLWYSDFYLFTIYYRQIFLQIKKQKSDGYPSLFLRVGRSRHIRYLLAATTAIVVIVVTATAAAAN